MAEKYQRAIVGDSDWTGSKQRCYDLLLEWVGGEHHLGKVSHFGTGLRMTTWRDVASFDNDYMTWLVILAHKHRCRVAVDGAGPRHRAIQVWARETEGSPIFRHPGLRDLIERCERHEQEDIATDTEGK
jgi:hypothetical protein